MTGRRLWPILALGMGACNMASAPVARDPFANLGMDNPAYKQLALALVLSENTKAGMRSRPGAGTCLAGWDPAAWFTSSIDLLKRSFARVDVVEKPEDAKAARADLVAVLDHTAAHHCFGAMLDLRLRAVFLTVDKQQIESISAENVRGNSKYNSSWNYLTGSGKIITIAHRDQAISEALGGFEKALFASTPLAEFARARPSAPAPQAAAAEPARPAPAPVSDVDRPAARGAARNSDFALVVGVESYARLPKAEFAERDAEAASRHFAALGLPERNIIRLTGQAATRGSLQGYLEEWLPRNAKPESTVFVYYSGHGAPDPKTGDAYLVPWDGDPTFLQSTAYPLKQLYAALGRIKAKQVIVALDSCFSGAGGRSVLAKGARPLVARAEELQPGGAVTVLAAASGEEITGSLEEQGHGMFTYFLLKGLMEGKRSAKDLFEYLKPRVQDEARRQNREQTPGLLGAPASF